jgi:hypothetical protein
MPALSPVPSSQFDQWGNPNPEFLIRVVSFKIFEVRRGAKPTGFSMRIASKVKSDRKGGMFRLSALVHLYFQL